MSKFFFRLGMVLRPTGAKVSRLAEFQSVKAEICLILVVPEVCRDNAWQRIFCGLGIMFRPLELKFQVWLNSNFKFG